jgi:hypothetical protein
MSTEILNLVIVISNWTKNNPLAEKRIQFTGTWSEGVERVNQLRAENPSWYIGLKWPC